MKTYIKIILVTFSLFGWIGCASGVKLATALSKDPATLSFSVQLVTPWGQENISMVRSGGTNSAAAQGGVATINK